MPPEVPLLNRVVLAILGFLFFHLKTSFFFKSVKNCDGILMEIALNLKISFSKIAIFYYVDSSYPTAWESSPFSDTFFNLFLKRLNIHTF